MAAAVSDKGTESESEFSSFYARLNSVPPTEEKEKGTATKYFGRRGGSTEPMELQEVTCQQGLT